MEYDVVLLPTFRHVDTWRKCWAGERRGGLFAQLTTTFDAWIADLWELHGDGRTPVNNDMRSMLMRSVASSEVLSGQVVLAAQCVKQASGVRVFEHMLDSVRRGKTAETLSAGEYSFAQMIVRYKEALAQRGYVELGETAALLADKAEEVFTHELRVLVEGDTPLTWLQEQFFEECDMLSVNRRFQGRVEEVGRASNDVQLQFAFPAGHLAQPALVGEVLASCREGSTAVVVCKNPLDWARRLEEPLLKQKMRLRVQAAKPFVQTDFGRAFLACNHVVGGHQNDASFLADAVRGFFSGFSRSDAENIDCAIRHDRVLDKELLLTDLRRDSELFSYLEEAAADPGADMLLDVFEKRVQAAAHRSSAWQAEQMAALRRVRSAMVAACATDVSMDACVELLANESIPVAWQVGEAEKGDVLLTTQALAQSLPQCACDIAVIADLTAQGNPLADQDNALSSFFRAIGLAPKEDAIGCARREFRTMLFLPGQRLVFSCPLGDENADETYPAAMLEEFMDAYRNEGDEDAQFGAFRVPSSLVEGVLVRGEELLFANSQTVQREVGQDIEFELPVSHVGDLDARQAGEVVRRGVAEHAESNQLRLSASQIETYLECPYRWFATYRMRSQTLDEGFGPLEKGTFAHAALERFYRRFQDGAMTKVTASTVEQAKGLMRQVLRELVDAQRAGEPGSGRLVAATELEKREVEELCNRLVSFLDFEAKLLPRFHPAYIEYRLGGVAEAEFAGCSLAGIVDRIDVDDDGHAVIIDYKGSVGSEHESADKDLSYWGKVQTRIYAQAVRRELGLNVVGALYVSYGKTPAVAGAYDPKVIDAAHLPGMRIERCSCGRLEEMPDPVPDDFSLGDLAFGTLLDETERMVAKAVNSMWAGDVAPRPAFAHACDYCQVISCPERGV